MAWKAITQKVIVRPYLFMGLFQMRPFFILTSKELSMPARNGNYDLVKDWIRENGTMPNGDKMPKRKMARMIYKEHNLNFIQMMKITQG